MSKIVYEMDEKELEAFIAQLEQTVAKLDEERPGSGEDRLEADLLTVAEQLLALKRKKKKPTDEVEL
jgi:hypothetical protein